MRERIADLAALLKYGDTYFYVRGLNSMDEGAVMALRDIANDAGIGWEQIAPVFKREGRLHLETY